MAAAEFSQVQTLKKSGKKKAHTFQCLASKLHSVSSSAVTGHPDPRTENIDLASQGEAWQCHLVREACGMENLVAAILKSPICHTGDIHKNNHNNS